MTVLLLRLCKCAMLAMCGATFIGPDDVALSSIEWCLGMMGRWLCVDEEEGETGAQTLKMNFLKETKLPFSRILSDSSIRDADLGAFEDEFDW